MIWTFFSCPKIRVLNISASKFDWGVQVADEPENTSSDQYYDDMEKLRFNRVDLYANIAIAVRAV